MGRIAHYLQTVALATDDEINAIFGGEPPPSPQGTISLRAAVAAKRGRGYKRWLGTAMCAILGRFQRDHCGKVLQSAIDQGQRL